MTKIRSVASVLKSSANRLQKILHHSQALRQLEPTILSRLPTDLAKHVHLANLEGDKLHLIADNGAWATRLRYLIPELKRDLELLHLPQPIKSIKLSVAPKSVPSQRPIRKAQLSTKSAQVVEECASTIGDKGLSAALSRLAKHGKRSR